MINIDDIKNITFTKSNFGGYKSFEVDKFIDDVHASYEEMQKENMALTDRIRKLEKKLEKYREEEESIRNAILSAQKLADASLIDADNKAKNKIFNASQEADEIIRVAKDEVEKQKKIAWNINMEAEEFRRRLVKMYEERLSELRVNVENDKFFSKRETQKLNKDVDKNLAKNLNENLTENFEKEASEIGGKLDKTSVFEVKFGKKSVSDVINDEISSGNDVYVKGTMQDIDSGICKEKKKLKNLKFGSKYRVSGREFGKGLYSGLFRRKK